tara:strand:- start:49 stop:273 length:225 start_codon:yes stop_codon:yes gene_type:complete
MKKSKKNKKQQFSPEDLMKDAENLFSFIDKFETLDLDKVNLDNLTDEIENIEKTLKDKYKDIIEESEDNVDTEE